MDYIKNTLLQNEKIVYCTGPHWIIFSPAMIAFGLLLFFLIFASSFIPNFYLFGYSLIGMVDFGLFVVSIFQAISCYVRYATSEYGVTTQRIISKVGFIRRSTLEVLLKRVESIQVAQSIMGRVLNYGTVLIRGTGGSFDAVYYIPNPLEFRRIAQQEITQNQQL